MTVGVYTNKADRDIERDSSFFFHSLSSLSRRLSICSSLSWSTLANQVPSRRSLTLIGEFSGCLSTTRKKEKANHSRGEHYITHFQSSGFSIGSVSSLLATGHHIQCNSLHLVSSTLQQTHCYLGYDELHPIVPIK